MQFWQRRLPMEPWRWAGYGDRHRWLRWADFSSITVAMTRFFNGSTVNDLTINICIETSGMILKNQLLATGQPVKQFRFVDTTLTATEV